MRINSEYLLMFLIFVSLSSESQSQNTNHILGIDGGYSFYPKEIGYKGDVGLDYIFTHKFFMLNVGVGIGPNNNYKLISKYNALVGFTTKINEPLSWHLLTGVIIATPYNSTYSVGNDSYIFSTGVFGINTGFYYRIKQSNFLLGIDALISTSDIEHVQKLYYQNVYINNSHSTKEFWYLNLNLSLNYKLKNKPPEKLPFFISKHIHLLGLGVGYTAYPKYLGYKGEINLNYLYTHKHFAFNFNADMAPFTNFGVIGKYSAGLGFTTRVERNFSWNFLFGYAVSLNSKPKYFIDEYHYYTFNIIGPYFGTGFYYKIPESNLLLGFNFSLATWSGVKTSILNNMYSSPGNRDSYNEYGVAASTKLSLNYKLNFKK